MAKLTLTDLTSIIGAETSAIAAINANGALIEAALENTLSRDGTTPNTMSSDLDMNTNDVNNVGTLRTTALTVNGNAISTAGMDWKGAWVTTTVYAVDEGVSNNGSSYICIAAHTAGATDDEPGVGATTATYWNQFAAKGATGAAGSTTIADDEFLVVGSADATKKLAFEVDGITTVTTRTWTVPDIDITFGAYTDTLVNVANEAAFKAAVNLETGTDVQAQSALLQDIADETLAQGDILYYDGANITNLGPGTSGQLLKTQGAAANPVWATVTTTGGWTVISTDTISSPQATWESEGISGYRTLKIIYDLVPVTDAVNLELRVGHSTTTYLTSGVYDGNTSWTLTSNTVGSTGEEFCAGEIMLYRFNQTKDSLGSVSQAVIDSAGSDRGTFRFSQINYATNALTAVRLYFSSGNIESGHVTVMGQ